MFVPFRTSSSSSSSSSDEEEKIHKSIMTKASRNKLSAVNVRDILKNVVTNEMVLAAVQMRADELDRQLEDEKQRVREQVLDMSIGRQKMTRKRAKELQHTPLKISDLSAAPPDKVIAHLMTTELSDEDDESDTGYEPNYDEEVCKVKRVK